MTPSEKYLMHRLEVAEDATRRGLIKGSANRTRFLAELHKKRDSRHRTEGERVAAAEQMQERSRQEQRDQLAGHSATPRPTTPIGMVASAAQQAADANRVRQEGRAWQVGAMRRELARQAWAAAAPSGSQVGAHARALESIARANGRG